MSVNPNTKLTPDIKQPIQCFKTTVKSLTTSDGLGRMKGLKIGQEVIIVILSKRQCDVVSKDGIEHRKWIFDIINSEGKPLGWIYAECVFPEMIAL